MSGMILTPGLDARYRADEATVGLDVKLRSSRYPSDEHLNSDDVFVDASAERRAERNNWRVGFGYAHDSTRYTEVLDTGRVQDNKRRDSIRISPSWLHALSERDSLQATYTFKDVSYTDGESVGLFDYDYHTLSGSFFRQLDVYMRGSVTLYVSDYESPDRGTEFNNIGIQAGISRAFSPTTEGELSVGVRSTETTIRQVFLGVIEVVDITTDNGGTINGKLTKRWPQTQLTAQLSRGVEPSGSGFAQLRDRLSIDVVMRLSERLSSSLSILGLRSESLNAGEGGVDRDYYSVAPRLRWRIDPRMRLSAGYRYRYQKYDDQANPATENAVDIKIDYSWRRQSASR